MYERVWTCTCLINESESGTVQLLINAYLCIYYYNTLFKCNFRSIKVIIKIVRIRLIFLILYIPVAVHFIRSLQFYKISEFSSICELSLDPRCNLRRKHRHGIPRYTFHDVILVRTTRCRERDRVIACFLSFRFFVFFAGRMTSRNEYKSDGETLDLWRSLIIRGESFTRQSRTTVECKFYWTGASVVRWICLCFE